VHPVGEVDVEAARLPEHHLRARRGAPKGVGPRVVRPVIRLDLGEADGDTRVREVAPEKLGCHLQSGAVEEGAGQSALRPILLPSHTKGS
jgi:hypothetical protein